MPRVIKLASHKDILTALSLRADIKSLRCHAFPRSKLLKKFYSRTLLKKYTMEEYPARLPSLLLSARYEQDFLQFITKSRRTFVPDIRLHYYIFFFKLCTQYKDKKEKILKNLFLFLIFQNKNFCFSLLFF